MITERVKKNWYRVRVKVGDRERQCFGTTRKLARANAKTLLRNELRRKQA